MGDHPTETERDFPQLKKKKIRGGGKEERGRRGRERKGGKGVGGTGKGGEGERKEGRKEGGREDMCADTPPLAENAQVQVTSSQVANNSNFHNCLSSKFL